MRKIGKAALVCFLLLLALIVTLGIGTAKILVSPMPLGDYRGVTGVLGAVSFIYLYAFLVYRAFLRAVPLKEGEIVEGSRAEFGVNVHFLFYLILFNALIRTHVLPTPMLRLIYLALGARLGRNTYSVGAILDPPLTEIGDNSIIGHDAVLFSHAIEGRRLSLAAIRIGNDVTVGAHAIIMSGVSIGDGAIVSAGAVVTKGARIAPGEVWGGVPARPLGRSEWLPTPEHQV